MKQDRLKIIEELITERPISTQKELQELLLLRGYEVTQATLSRDIKELGLVKQASEAGGYRYAVSAAPRSGEAVREQFKTIFRQAVISISLCGNLVILKCHTGTGNAACAALDSLELPQIVGTIAGDDTIFCAVQEQDGEAVAEKLHQMIWG